MRAFLLFCCVAFFSIHSFAHEEQKSVGIQLEEDSLKNPFFASTPYICIEPFSSDSGGVFRGVVALSLADGWHTYWKNPGDIGSAPNLSWKLPAGLEVASVEWPVPVEFSVTEGDLRINSFGYAGQIYLIVTFKASSEYNPTKDPSVIQAHLECILCNESQCVPEEINLHSELIATADNEAKSRFDEILARALLQMPEEKSNILLRVSDDHSALELVLPAVNFDKSALSSTAQVSLFFEEPQIQTTSRASLIASSDRSLYSIKLQVPQKKLLQLLDQKDNKLFFSGVYKVVFSNIQDSSQNRQFFGKFTKVFLSDLQSDIEKKKSVENDGLVVEEVKEASTPDSLLKQIEISSNHEQNDKANLWIFLGLAFIGGIILNIMPCVLPVIGLKVLHLLSFRGEEDHIEIKKPKSALRFGFSFTIGVVVAFWILALIVYMLQYMGSTVGWGFQLQEPWFVLSLIIILFSMSLSLFGLYEFGMSVGSKAAALETNSVHQSMGVSKNAEDSVQQQSEKKYYERTQHLQSFLSGFLVTSIATPCTGPLLGSVAGFLATLNPIQGFAIFTALGLGVSFPYLFFTAFPGLIKLLPRPGKWMITFKQFLGFLLLATVFWLLWVLDAQVGPLSTVKIAGVFLLLSLSAWIYGHWATPVSNMTVRCIATILAIILAGLSLYQAPSIINKQQSNAEDKTPQDSQELNWRPFSLKALHQSLQENKPVLVEVTAKWCLTCQINKAVFFSSKVSQTIKDKGIVLYRADWTKKDDEITQFLRSFGRNGVPTYIYFPQHDINNLSGQALTPKGSYLLPELLTVDSFLQVVNSDSSK